jgi:hypothetical protein
LPKAVFPVAGSADCISVCRQNSGNDVADIRFIVDHEDARPWRATCWPSCDH